MTFLDERVRDSLFELPDVERAALADDLLASLDQPGCLGLMLQISKSS